MTVKLMPRWLTDGVERVGGETGMTIRVKCMAKHYSGVGRSDVRLQHKTESGRVHSILLYELDGEAAAAFQPGREYTLAIEEMQSA